MQWDSDIPHQTVTKDRIERLLVMYLILVDEVPEMSPSDSVLGFLRTTLADYQAHIVGSTHMERMESDFWNCFIRLQVGALFGERDALRAYCRILPIYRPECPAVLARSLN